jgi:hypothetical protein
VLGLAIVWGACAVLLPSASAADPSAGWPPFAPAVTTGEPSGVFRYLRLKLENAPGGAMTELDLIARDSRIVQARVNGGSYAVCNGLKLDDTKLSGEFAVSFLDKRSICVFDVSIASGVLKGTYTLRPYDSTDTLAGTGAVTGELLTEAQLAKSNAVDPVRNWPEFAGPLSDFSAIPCGKPLVTDHMKASLVWRSEALLPHGPGSATRSNPGRATAIRNASSYTLVGGSAEPIVSNGRVIQVVHEASPKELAIPGLDRDEGYVLTPSSGQAVSARTEFRNLTAVCIPMGSWEACEARYGKFWTEMERRRWSLHADDVIVAMDAATGKTLWRTVLPQRSFNFSDHKNHYCGHAPVAIGNRIVAVGGSRRLYGLDATTGKVLWETPLPGWPQAAELMIGKVREKWTRQDGPNLGSADGVALVPSYAGSLLGVDPETGKTLWEVAGSGDSSRLTVGGKALVFDGKNGIEPKTGKILWSLPEVASEWAIKGDLLAVSNSPKKMDGQPNPDSLVLYRVSFESATQVWAKPDLRCHRMVVAKNAICMIALTEKGNELKMISLADGSILWAPGVIRPPPAIYPNHANAPGLAVVEDRVLINLDSAHGAINVVMVLDAGKDSTFMSYADGLPMNMTGPYNGGFWSFTVADGRMFVRGSDGLYCFDLRVP